MDSRSKNRTILIMLLLTMTIFQPSALVARDYTNPGHSRAGSLYMGTSVFAEADAGLALSQDRLHTSSVDPDAVAAISAGIEQSFTSYRTGFSKIALYYELSQKGPDMTDGAIIISLSRSETISTRMDIYYGVDLGLVHGAIGDNTGRTGFAAGLHVGPHMPISDHVALRTSLIYMHRFWGEDEGKIATEHHIGARLGITLH